MLLALELGHTRLDPCIGEHGRPSVPGYRVTFDYGLRCLCYIIKVMIFFYINHFSLIIFYYLVW